MSGTEPTRVLVIDDDEMTLATVRKLLEAQGVSADGSLSAREALARLPETRYDAILCDMWMPGMTGKQFYQQVAKEFPEYQSRIIFLTGDIASEATWDFIEQEHLPYLLKPVSIPELRQKLQEVVGERAGAALAQARAGERRRHHRIAMKAAVRVRNKRWAGGGPETIAVGNACKEGVYFITDRQYRIGTEVLACFPYTGSNDLEQPGCVVRVEEHRGGRWGVAIALGGAAAGARASLDSKEERRRERILAVGDTGTEAPPIESVTEAAVNVDDLKRELARARDEAQRLAQELGELRVAHERVAGERDRLAAAETDRSLQLQELTSAKAAMTAIIEDRRHQVETLQHQLATAAAEREQLARAREEAQRLAQELGELRVAHERVAGERDRLAAAETDRNLQLQELTSAKAAMTRMIEELKQQVETLQAQLATAAAEREREAAPRATRKARARAAEKPEIKQGAEAKQTKARKEKPVNSPAEDKS